MLSLRLNAAVTVLIGVLFVTSAIAAGASGPPSDRAVAERGSVAADAPGGSQAVAPSTRPQTEAQPQNESEPNDQRSRANELEPGTVLAGSLAENDEDWFAVTTSRGASITVDLTRLPGGGQVYLRLTDPDGATIAFTTAEGGERTTIGATAQQNGTYYVSVRYADAAGSYELEVTTATTDAFEPNEGADTATPISSGEPVRGTQSRGDEDWFAIDVERGEAVTVNVTRLSDGGEFSLRVTDPDGRTVTFALVGSRERVTTGLTAQQTGTYYVSITSFGATGPYELNVTAAATDAFEPNEDADTAVSIANGVPVGGQLTTGDEDWFSIRADRGEVVVVELERPTDDGVFTLIARDPDSTGEGFTTLPMRGSTRVEFEATQTGIYVFQTRQSGGTGPYTLTATTYSREAEPNDREANATGLLPDDRAIGTVERGDTDAFAVNVTRGDALTVAVERRGGEGDLTASLVRDGVVYDSVTLRADQRATLGVTANSTGTYTVVVGSGETGDGTGEYTLALGTQRTGDSEPNERVDDAASIAPGETVAGTVTANDRDWFAFAAAEGESISVALDSVVANRTDLGAGTGSFVAELRGPDGEPIDTAVVDDGERASFDVRANATGRYAVGVRGETGAGDLGASVGSYSLTVRTSPTDPNEPNDGRATATSVRIGDSVEAALGAGDADWYAVDATANATFSITLDGGSPDGLAALVVYDARGQPLTQEFVRTANETTSRTEVDAGGTVVVQIVGLQGDASPYTVTFEATNSTG